MFKINDLYFIISFLIFSTCFALCGWSFFGSSQLAPTPLIQAPRFTLMIDPAGDAKDTGREIDDTFERALTMQCAEELKREIEGRGGIRVILTRFPGETVEPLQNAAFANRLKVDLYLSLHFYETKDKVTKLYMYYTLYDPGTDFWGKKADELSLLPFDQAYKINIKKTDSIAKELHQQLKKDERNAGMACMAPLGLPIKPLAGIIAPAITLELGLKKKDDWRKMVPLLVTSLETLANASHGTST